MKTSIIYIFVLCALVMVACRQKSKGPQKPSRWMGKEIAVDSTQLALLEFNQKMVVAADKLLTEKAQQAEEEYALYENNTWIYFLQRGNEADSVPMRGDKWTIRMLVYSLETGQLFIDVLREFQIGKGELPIAVDNNITEFAHGARARMLVPWYAAYGIQGTDEIPPYENLIIEIDIK